MGLKKAIEATIDAVTDPYSDTYAEAKGQVTVVVGGMSDGSVTMEAGATGNGSAKAYLESVYGTLLVGVCECPNSPPVVQIVSDVQMFIRTDADKGAVDVALGDMQKAVDRISKDIESGAQDTDKQPLVKRIESELKRWGDQQAGERFKSKEGKKAD